MKLPVLILLANITLLCLAKIDESNEDGAEKPHRFLRPDEIEGQILPKSTSTSVTTSGPNLFNGQKFSKPNRKVPPFMSLVPSNQLPIGRHTTRVETAFSLEASGPILRANENEPVNVEQTLKPTQRTTTTTKVPDELDEQEENEIDTQLGSNGMSMRLAGDSITIEAQPRYKLAKIDEVAEFHRNVVTDMSPYIFVLGGFREGNKDELRKSVFLPSVDKYFPIYEKLLDENHSGFFGKGITWIDFSISEFFTTVSEYEPFILKKYPSLVRFVAKVHQLPQIRHYIRTRNKTPLNQ